MRDVNEAFAADFRALLAKYRARVENSWDENGRGDRILWGQIVIGPDGLVLCDLTEFVQRDDE